MPNIKPVSDLMLKLMEEIEKGEKSGRENGWFSIEEAEKILGVSNN